MRAKFIKDFLFEIKIGDIFAKLDHPDFKKYSHEYGDFKKDEVLLEKMFAPSNMRAQVFKLVWYNTPNHNIYNRIKDRTDFNTVSAFNKSIKESLTKFFQKHFKTSLYDRRQDLNTKVCLYVKEQDYYVLFAFKFQNLLLPEAYINMITILGGKSLGCKNSDIQINI